MRRVPVFVWILAPLAIGIAYALLYPLLAPRPSLLEVVPAEAILTHRYRDLPALDRAWYGSPNDPYRPSERIASRRNLPELPGVDPTGALHLVFLPRAQRPDPTMMIFPLSDAKALRARFEDAFFFLERGLQRHAQFLEIRGDYAAIGGDREAVRTLGTGGITAPVLGEDHVLAVRVPEMIRYMLISALDAPWRGILHLLGFDPRSATPTEDGHVEVTGRVARVHDAWRTARIWSWLAEGRIRLDLTPAPGPLAEALTSAHASPASTDALPTAPPTAEAWLRLENARARAAVAWALHGAGVPFPEGAVEESLGQAADDGAGGLLVWAAPSIGRPEVWTIVITAPRGRLPDLSTFHPAIPESVGDAEAGEGELPLTLAIRGRKDPSPAAPILRREVGGGTLELVAAGTSAEQAWRRFETHLALDPETERREPPEAGLTRLATFGLSQTRARTLLGGVVGEGGFLQALSGGDVTGEIWTDGTTLRIEARVARGP